MLSLLVMNGRVLAQGCQWCTSVTDACCDGEFSDVVYTLPCNTSTIYIQYDGTANNRAEFIIADVSGGQYTELVHGNTSDNDHCNCAKYLVYNLSINANHDLRFKVNCRECTETCDNGNLTVKFFTPSSNTCAPNCSGS